MTGPGLVPVVRRWWWLLVAAALLGGVTAWIVASSATKTYEAEAKLLVGPVSGDYPTLQAAGALGRTYAELAHSRRVVAAAARDAGVKLTSRQLEDAVSASSNDVTRIVDLRARHQDPEIAAKLTGAVARQLIGLRANAPIEDVDPVDAIMRDPSLGALAPADLARVRKAAVHALGRSNAGDIEMIEAPLAPRSAASPRVGLLVMLGALAGLLIASAYVLMREGGSTADDGFDAFVLDDFPPVTNGVAEAEGSESWLEEARRRE
ncbi:MAG TPA: Wzz/FepE/Etk N-terminal domain-containing protein [Thermoleophilaceae bacterium]